MQGDEVTPTPNESESEENRFDVFLSHNSKDKPEVLELWEALKLRGVKPWIDASEIVDGDRWLKKLEAIIQECSSATVCIGAHGIGPWQDREIGALIRRQVAEEATDGRFPIIPVFLKSAPKGTALPIFLAGYNYVDLREGSIDNKHDDLASAIKGERVELEQAPEPQTVPLRRNWIGKSLLGTVGILAVTLAAFIFWPRDSAEIAAAKQILENTSWEYGGEIESATTIFADLAASSATIESALAKAQETSRALGEEDKTLSQSLQSKIKEMESRQKMLATAVSFEAQLDEFDPSSFSKLPGEPEWHDKVMAIGFLAFRAVNSRPSIDSSASETEQILAINELRSLTKSNMSQATQRLLESTLKPLLQSENPWVEIGYELILADSRSEDAADTLSKLSKINRATSFESTLWKTWVEKDLLERLIVNLTTEGFSNKLMRRIVDVYRERPQPFLLDFTATYLLRASMNPSFEAQFIASDKRACREYFGAWFREDPSAERPAFDSIATLFYKSVAFRTWLVSEFQQELESGNTDIRQLIENENS